MVYTYIVAALESLDFVVPTRLFPVVVAYLIALMSESAKHSLSYAAAVAGGHVARYSRLLSEHHEIAQIVLSRQARRALRKLAAKRTPLVPGAPWTVAIIVDATLHPRSSRHLQNAQRLSHGGGFVVGHQWTNIVLVIGDKTIPLPPIPFWTKAERRARKLADLTEHERVIAYLSELNLADLIGQYQPAEVVALMDSGYDDSDIVNAVVARGWDVVWALKTNRSIRTEAAYQRGERKGRRVDALFKAMRKQAPWHTIRPKAKGKNRRRRYRARCLTGRVKAVQRDLMLVCSEKSGRTKGRRYLACTRKAATIAQVILAYELRWRVESFHRAVKSRLGMTEAGLSSFDAIRAHVHWVYCAYILLEELQIEGISSLEDKQRAVSKELTAKPFRETIQALLKSRTQYGGVKRAERLAQAALQGGKVA
jgi:hypothetical protein